jgi:hypothetical protein
MGEGELELYLPSPKHGRGAGGEGKDLSYWDAPLIIDKLADSGDANVDAHSSNYQMSIRDGF